MLQINLLHHEHIRIYWHKKIPAKSEETLLNEAQTNLAR